MMFLRNDSRLGWSGDVGVGGCSAVPHPVAASVQHACNRREFMKLYAARVCTGVLLLSCRPKPQRNTKRYKSKWGIGTKVNVQITKKIKEKELFVTIQFHILIMFSFTQKYLSFLRVWPIFQGWKIKNWKIKYQQKDGQLGLIVTWGQWGHNNGVKLSMFYFLYSFCYFTCVTKGNKTITMKSCFVWGAEVFGVVHYFRY